uniref:Inter-alpha-trypsin inhibitor heavy chain H1 n=1 Tax=Mesocricetus auratus TaxID=10036 RepID=ITIH1_MESAU|nr:RecName: Full=Inter-alpha-trypsin inhibitor heavy chain H1; Short=ITI heavy chain H1; Short=ITI-HC1; Short=Inter-alpha-inhibitor heavy chain 1; Flags: Precursor [Mesocricetus auratus]BAA13938.1 inter-alpha-trypsin inhibitor heavy chain 1 [Mesocricetus auratus]
MDGAAVGLRVLLGLGLVSLLTLEAMPAAWGLATTGRPRAREKRQAVDTTPDGVLVKSLKVNCKVTSRFAHYIITSQVVNRQPNEAREVAFDVEIPKTAFISDFAITADGNTFIGDIKDKASAWKQYRKAISGENAGLVRTSGRNMEQFTIHITVGAQSKATFQLTYEEVLKRRLTQYDIVIKVKPKQLVQHFEIDVDIFEPQGISKLDAQASFLSKELAAQTIKESFSGKKGHVLFRPTVSQQQQPCPTCSTSWLNGDFKVTYDVNRDKLCDLLVANNYFAHFFAPKNLTNMSKNLVFVIDISGSMEGQKVKQTKEALLKILGDVKPGDSFDLVLFGSRVQSWKGSLVPATQANLQAAQDFVRRFSLAGATNLNGGLLRGIEILNKAQGSHPELSSPASILIMLTDGEPTEGETDRSQILKNVRNAIRGRFPLYNLGFGHDLDFNFLEVMSMENSGWAQRIYEDHDATQQLQGFYNQVANPLLTDVELQYPQDSVLSLTQHRHKQYYDGSEIVVAGRIADHKLSTFKADVRARGERQEFKATCLVDEEEMKKLLRERGHMLENHVERLWAYLTIQELLAKRMKMEGEERANLSSQALKMSLDYQFVTPLTSMTIRGLTDEDGLEPTIDKTPEDSQPLVKVGPRRTFVLSATQPSPTARSSVVSKLPNQVTGVDTDPHFIIYVPQKEDSLCFNINEEPGVILSLVQDPDTGFSVNGQLIGSKPSRPGQHEATYFGRLGISNPPSDFQLEVTPRNITLNPSSGGPVFSWRDQATPQKDGVLVTINKKRNLVVSVEDGATFEIVLHRTWKGSAAHQDFLGFYVLDSSRMSARTRGLLGQFFCPLDFEVSDIRPGSDPMKLDATMRVKNRQLAVTRGLQRDYSKDPRHGTEVSCWFIHNNGAGLIDGVHTDYIVPDIF